MAEVTQSLEDYLEAIYICQTQNEEVRITDVAAKTGFSKPSVNRAVNTLRNAGLVKHEYYGKITLTKEGRQIAQKIYSRHVNIKNFLINQLGVDEATAEEDACRMEHGISETTMNRLIEYINRTENEIG